MRQRIKVTTLGIIGGLLVLLMVAAVGCNDPEPTAVPTATATTAPTVTPTPEPRPTPTPLTVEALVEATYAAMGALESAHIEGRITMTARDTGEEEGTVEMSMVGDYQAPDRARLSVSLTMEGNDFEADYTTIANETYIRFPGIDIWQVSDSSDGLDLRETLRFDPDGMENLVLIGEEELDGEKVYHLRGFLASDAGGLLNSVPGALVGMTPLGEVVVEVEFWIGVGDFLVRRTIQNIDIELSSGIGEGGELNLELDMRLSDYGGPVDIQAPDVESTFGTGPGYSETQAPTPIPAPTATPVPAIAIPPTPESTPTPAPTAKPPATATPPPPAPSPTASAPTMEPTASSTLSPEPTRTPTSESTAASDREILVEFYHATGGPNWEDNTNWLSAAPTGQWHGVSTDPSGRVVELLLPENRLSGEIPPELSNLANLQVVYIANNELSGEIPSELGRLRDLWLLSLSENTLSGCVPQGLRYVLLNDFPDLGLPFCGPPTPAASDSMDREALVALYNAADGANWTNNDNWLSDAPIGEWYGVTVDSNGRVIGLNLYNTGLGGEIPQELGNLTALRALSLENNRLSGEIPQELGNLTALQALNLGDNRLSGEIPQELGNLTALQALNLGGNQLSGEIPPWFGSLQNLSWLFLYDNQLSGEIPPELGSLAKLRRLFLSDNRLSGEIPQEFGSLTNLSSLFLSDNELSGCMPDSLLGVPDNDFSELSPLPCSYGTTEGSPEMDKAALVALYNATDGPNWTNNSNWLSDAPVGEWHGVTADPNGRVVALSLVNKGLVGKIPPELSGLTNLYQLDLSLNQLSGGIPMELGSLTNLLKLRLNRNQFSGEIPLKLGDLTNLQDLNLAGNQLSGEIPMELGSITSLQTLFLGNNQLSGEAPSWLGGLWNLAWLDLSLNRLSGEIPPELGNLSNLGVLALGGNELSGEIPPELGSLSNLWGLDLSGNQLSGEIPPKLGNLSNLLVLALDSGKRVKRWDTTGVGQPLQPLGVGPLR